jgi:DNA-binding IclR family transcriptional regulator
VTVTEAPTAHAAGGVLAGALADADEGLGLSALSRTSGLAKTSAYRLAEQHVTLGVGQRSGGRYFVGARAHRIALGWQPDPQLRQAPIPAFAPGAFDHHKTAGRVIPMSGANTTVRPTGDAPHD